MSRIRSIKPEFWTSAQVMECSTNARLLFIGMWNFADDAGRHVDSPKQLKAEVFPSDEISLENVRGMVDELSANGLVIRYTVGGASLLQVTGWKHQRIDKPQKPRFPGPDDDDSGSTPGTIQERSRLIRSDPIGKDTKGKDLNTAASNPKADDAQFESLRTLYPKRGGDQRWHEARQAINARLREGCTWQQILDGAARYAAWCKSTGKLGTETVKQAATFVGPGKAFLEPWNPPATKADVRLSGNLEAAAEFMRNTEPAR